MNSLKVESLKLKVKRTFGLLTLGLWTVFDGAGRGLLNERSVKTLTTEAAPFPANKQAKWKGGDFP